MRRTEPIEITRDYIMANRTKRGAWTKLQIEALGIEWPPRQGWIDELIGEVISAEQANQFESRTTQSEVRQQESKRASQETIDGAIQYLYDNVTKMNTDQIARLATVIGNAKRKNAKRR